VKNSFSNSATSPTGPEKPADLPFVISSIESKQIDVARSLCIFFMVGVHIFPSIRETSFLYQGEFHYFWLVYVDFLGRASVATLSFVSGYVLYAHSGRKSVADVFTNRINTVYLPMVTWNFIKVIMVAALVVLEGGTFLNVLERLEISSLLSALNSVFAITDTPANITISFLRDFFISLVLARMLVPFMRQFGLIIVTIALALAVFKATDPIILRPSVLFFVLLGVYSGQKGWSLSRLANWKISLPIAGILFAMFLFSLTFSYSNSDLGEELPNLLKRSSLIFFLLWLSLVIARRFELKNIASFRSLLYLTYLSHGMTSQVLGVLWKFSGTDNHSPVYLVYFFANIVAFFLIAVLLNRMLPSFPRRAQIILSGRARN
jgi:hypothetical protein